MTATSVAASATMINPFAAPTAGSSTPAVNPFAPKPDNNNKANPFASGDAGVFDAAKTRASNGGSPFALSSDSDKNRKTTNPFASGNETNASNGKKHAAKFGNPAPRAPASFSNGGAGFGGAQLTRKPFPENAGSPPSQPSRQKRPGSSSSHHSSDDEGAYRYRRSNDPHAINVYGQLRRDAIHAPKWPSRPGHPETKAEMARFRDVYEEYRSKVRVSLTKANLIDDPNERKKLSDALDFRGICEEMCPDFEKITRIAEGDIQGPERDPRTKAANPRRMIKRLARSAAGQEAPLPMDVRSIACLKRTLDYLMDEILQRDENLQYLHGFLWDRTRAIRRDFTFFSSLTPEELQLQIYCLENITRFHVTVFHLVYKDGKRPEAFSDQQEMEQLGKALLTLRDLYDDCEAQGMTCENEAEFRAYYLLFHAADPSILEKVQRQWRPNLWRDSDVIRSAVSLVEALQNTQSFHGPLAQAPFMAASNAISSYFRIVASPQISYTMACFAELHFPRLRHSILSAVKGSMSRPKGQALDVNVNTLNKYLHFDTLQEVVDFAEHLDISVIPDQEAPNDFGRQVVVLDGRGSLPRPRMKHQFSQKLVERKRSGRPLPTVIHQTVFEDAKTSGLDEIAEEQSLFVREDASAASAAAPAEFKPAGNPFASLSRGDSSSKVQPTAETQNKSPFNNPFSSKSGTASAVFGSKPSPAPTMPGNNATPSFGTASTHRPAEAASFASQPGQSALPKPSPFGSAFAPTSNVASQSSPFSQKPLTAAPASTAASPSLNAPTAPSANNTAKPALIFGQTQPSKGETNASEQGIIGASLGQSSTPQTTPPSSSTPLQGATSVLNQKPASPFAGFPSTNTSPPPKPSSPATLPSQPPTTSLTTEQTVSTQAPSPPAASAFGVPKQNSLQPRQPKPTPPKRDLWMDIAKWYVLADKGLIEDFQTYVAEDILRGVYDTFVAEQEERRQKEEDERLLGEARKFRVKSLSIRFFYRWRQNARQKRLKSLRRNGRDQMKKYYEAQRAEEARAQKEASAKEREQKAKEALKNRPEEILERLRRPKTSTSEAEEALLASGVLAGVTDERGRIARLVRKEYDLPSLERPGRSFHRSTSSRPPSRSLSRQPAPSLPLSRPSSRQSNRSVSSSTASRNTSKTDKLRAELAGARPQGFRRSLPPMVANNRSSRASSSSGVSERWRLKAMGIVQMPDGTAMPEFLAHEVQHQGRSVPGMLPPARRASMTGAARSDRESMPPPPLRTAQRETSPNKRKRESDGSLKAGSSHKRVMSEAERMIAELRELRGEMEEGTSWFRSQNERLQTEISSRGTTPWDDEI